MNLYFEALKKYAIFNGRAQRDEFWLFTLLNIIIVLALTLIDMLVGMYDFKSALGISFVYIFLITIPSISIIVRRLHDTNRSGWWFFILFIPIIGFIVLVIFLVQDSKEDNKYGKNLKDKFLLDYETDIEIERLTFLKNKGIIID